MGRRAAAWAVDRTQAPKDAGDLARSKLRLLGVALLCAKVALVPLIFVYPLDAPFTVSKALLSHGLAWMLAGVLAGLVINFGRSFLLFSWLHVPVLGFLAASAAATVFAAEPYLALYGAHQRMLGLGTVADWTVLYFAVALLVRTRTDAVAVIGFGLAASVFVLTYEAIQLLGADPFSWSMDETARPFSTIGQPTSLAQYLTTLALGCLALGAFVEGLHRGARAGLIVGAAALLAGAAATGTRSAVLGIAAGSALLVLVTWIAHPSPRARTISLVAGAGATAGLAALLVLSPLGARLAQTFESAASDDEDFLSRLEPSTAGRVALYGIAFEMVKERPLLGYGPDNFVVGVPRYRTENEPREIQLGLASSPHSWVGYVATGSGLIGLTAFVSIVAVALWLTLRSGFHPVTVAAAATLGAFLGTGLTTVNDIGTDWLFWASTGAIAAATAVATPAPTQDPTPGGRRKSKPQRPAPGSGPRAVISAVCIAAGLVVAVAGINAFDASASTRQGRDARLNRRPNAIELAARATQADPGRAEYWHGLGLAYVGANRLVDATVAFDRASRLAPYDVRYIGDQARALLILARNGDATARGKAIDLSERAIRTDPNHPDAQLTRAVVMQGTGNLPEALRSVQRALALDPQSRNVALWVTATQVRLESGSPTDAIRIARQGLGILGTSRGTIPLRIELARALVAIGQPLEALKELDLALSIQPNEPSVERLRAQISASLGR